MTASCYVVKKEKRLCQNSGITFFMRKARNFPSPGFVITQSFFVILGIKIPVMAKLHFRPYILNQTILFPQRIDENIATEDPVRIVNAVVDSFNLNNFKNLYKKDYPHNVR